MKGINLIKEMEIWIMTFTYPAVFTPHKEGKGFHVEFPDLECCEADGGDLEKFIPYVHACPLHRYGKAGGVRLRRIMVPSAKGGGLGVKNAP